MKRLMSVSLCLVLGLSFLTGGCVVTESENVETSGMWARFVIEHYPDDTVDAWAVLRVGGQTGTIIDLVGDDHMYCNGTPMTEYIEPITNFHWTRAMNIGKDPNGEYEFEFSRAEEDVYTLVVTPDVPLITYPLPGDTVFPEDEITLEWDDSIPGDYVNIFLTGGCIQYQEYWNVDDDADFLMDPIQDQDSQNPTDCAAYLEIRRFYVGEVAPEFQDGFTEAKRIDGIDLSYEQP